MSERAFVKIRVHLEHGEIWATADCSQAHVPCGVNGSLEDVGAWLREHLLEFHTPKPEVAP